MAWSTREVAELAGTTVKAVRHYHKLGLLAEPERGSNGYKRYQVHHLIRLLRIRRLTDLGLPLARIAELGEADEHPDGALKTLDAELGATIERLQRMRAELALMMRGHLPTDLPSHLSEAVGGVSEADRDLVVVYSRILDQEGTAALRGLLADNPGDEDDPEFENLPADADQETRRALATKLLDRARAVRSAHHEVTRRLEQDQGGTAKTRDTIRSALTDLYNPAQLDVLARIAADLER